MIVDLVRQMAEYGERIAALEAKTNWKIDITPLTASDVKNMVAEGVRIAAQVSKQRTQRRIPSGDETPPKD